MSAETILIIDDNPDNVELTTFVLEHEGFDVRSAYDAEQAMGVLSTFHPQLILMDIQMPGVDGLELTRRLRSDATFDDIIIVALTAYAMKGDEERILAAGCDEYIPKPIDTRTFGSLVKSYLSTRAHVREIASKTV